MVEPVDNLRGNYRRFLEEGMAKLTARQKELRGKYTRLAKVAGEWTPFLQIDQQGFQTYASKTKKGAEWTRDMLAIALDRMIEDERNT